MASDLDLSEGAGAPGRARALLLSGRRLGLGLAALGLLGVVLGLTGWAAVPLCGAVLAGAGLTYLSGLALTLEERLAYGAVIGALALAAADLLLALAFGMTAWTVLAAVALVLGASAPGWWRARGLLEGELDDLAGRWARREPWPLWLLLGIAWPYTLVLFARAYSFTAGALVAGNEGAYADWAAHLTYAGSFAYGHNFPPEFPVDPGHRLAYPFLVDVLAAGFVPLGTSLTSALVLSSALLALAFPAVMYLAGVRLTGTRVGSALAVLVFTLSGGIGFLRALGPVARSGLAGLLPQGPLFTQDVARNYQWLNPVLAWMVPQRSVLYGFSLALLVVAMLWVALGRGREAGWAPFAFTGVVTGLVPLAHLHAYGTIVALMAFWAVLSPRRQWAAFFVPALALGLPVVLWMLGGGAAAIKRQPWWLADTNGHLDGPVWFWLKNTGLLVPAVAAAFVWRGTLPDRLALHLAPVWLWFLVPNFVVFQPWDWDNTKFFAYWALFGSLAAGALLVRLPRLGPVAAAGAVVLALTLVASGTLDVARQLEPEGAATFTGAGGVRVAAWARANTDRRAVFLVAPVHNDPIPTLAGRRVVAGYPGWLWTYGLSDWSERTADAQRMLKGDPATLGLLHRYGVSYVVLGPEDQSVGGSNAAYFDGIADRVYDSGGYTVYRVH